MSEIIDIAMTEISRVSPETVSRIAFNDSLNRFLERYEACGLADYLNQWYSQLVWGLAGLVALWLVIRLVRKWRAPKLSESEKEELKREQGIFGALTPALAAQIPESEKESSDFAKMLRQAGIYAPSAAVSIYALRFVLLFTGLVATGIAVILLPARYGLAALVAGCLVAGFMSITPRLYIFFRRRRRITEIQNGLPDMMDMLSMCIDAGMPLSPSLDHVSKSLTGHPALAQELQILKRQAEMGSLRLALADLGRRVDLPEMRQVANLLRRGDQLGTQMSSVLHEQADHFRTNRQQQAMMQANKAPIKLTLPLLFCFAPATLILLISPALLELYTFFVPKSGEPTTSIIANSTTTYTAQELAQTFRRVDLDQQVQQNTPFDPTQVP